MLVMVVFFIAFRWIHLSTPLIRLFLLVLILLLMPTLNFLPVWFALSLLLKVKNVLALALVVRSRCEVLKASVKALVFGMQVVNNFNCRGFGPLLEDKLCLIFKLAPSVCRMTFPILASLLVRLVVLLPFQLLRLSMATPSRWTPLALSVFLHCVVALLLTLL